MSHSFTERTVCCVVWCCRDDETDTLQISLSDSCSDWSFPGQRDWIAGHLLTAGLECSKRDGDVSALMYLADGSLQGLLNNEAF